jgi:hypothetical protein
MTMPRPLVVTFIVISLAASALAQEPPPPPPGEAPPPPVMIEETAPAPEEAPLGVTYGPALDPPAFGVGAKLGVLLPQVSTELSTAVTGGVELSFALPFAGRRLALFVESAYAQPEVSRSGVTDPRVPGGAYDGTQTQRELVVGGGLLLRALPPASVWNGYALLGARGYFLETITVGSAGGADFGENREQSARFGGIFAAGGERLLGPGVLLLEVGFGTSSLPHLITGDVTTGAVAIQLGYRVLF